MSCPDSKSLPDGLRFSSEDNPTAIDCPLCGERVAQVASATLSLALWQHVNWVCSRATSGAAVLSLEEARMVSLEDLRADIIRSAARGQGPTFIAAKLDILIAKATFVGVLPEAK